MKKLIIVCEEKLRRYGDFLAQLISGTDDIDALDRLQLVVQRISPEQ